MSRRNISTILMALSVCPLVFAFAQLSLGEQASEETRMTTAIILDELIVDVLPPEITKSGVSEVVVVALTSGMPVPGQEVTFRVNHGNSSRHGTIAPPVAVTDETGMASAIFTPRHPGKIHIKVESGSQTRNVNVRVRP